MGMYQDIQFEAELNALGLEVWADLVETRSWTGTAERMSYYAFLELAERASAWIPPLPTWSGVLLEGNRLLVDTTKASAMKDRGGDLAGLLRVFLGPLVSKPFEVVYTHEVTGRRCFTVEPIPVEPEWDRMYGDPTGV